jgi:hypothetical protein
MQPSIGPVPATCQVCNLRLDQCQQPARYATFDWTSAGNLPGMQPSTGPVPATSQVRNPKYLIDDIGLDYTTATVEGRTSGIGRKGCRKQLTFRRIFEYNMRYKDIKDIFFLRKQFRWLL